MALVEVQVCTYNLNKHRIVVYRISKHSTTFIFNITLSVSIVSRQLLVGSNTIYQMENHLVNFTNAEDNYG